MTDDYDSRHRFAPIVLGIMAAVGLTILFQIGAVLLAAVGASDAGEPRLSLPAIGVAQLVMMLLPTLYLSPPLGLRPGPLLRLRSVPITTVVAAVVGTLAMWGLSQTWLLVQEVFIIPNGLEDLYRQMTSGTEQMYSILFGSTTVIGVIGSMIVGALIPAISEETLFRGLVLSLFERSIRPTGAIALASFLFAVLHLQPFMLLPLMALGYYFGYLAWRTGSIVPSIVGHLLFNAVSLVALHAPDAPLAASPQLHTADDLVVVLPVTVVSSMALVAVVWWMESGRRRHMNPAP